MRSYIATVGSYKGRGDTVFVQYVFYRVSFTAPYIPFPVDIASFFFFGKKETPHGSSRGSHIDGCFDRQQGKQFIVRIVFAQDSVLVLSPL